MSLDQASTRDTVTPKERASVMLELRSSWIPATPRLVLCQATGQARSLPPWDGPPAAHQERGQGPFLGEGGLPPDTQRFPAWPRPESGDSTLISEAKQLFCESEVRIISEDYTSLDRAIRTQEAGSGPFLDSR